MTDAAAGTRNQEIIRLVRAHADSMRAQELEKALRKIERGEDPGAIVEQLAHALTNKWLHQPTTVLREAAEDDDQTMIVHARRLFGVDPDDA